MTTTVHVKNIAAATGDAEVKDFFGFCGKITDIKVTTEGETRSAEVTFEKETAMKTALLLNNTQLGPNHITVSSATGDSEDDGSHFAQQAAGNDEITQEMKPRTRILAEYLAHGYVVGDATIQRAIELDQKHGVSARFLGTLQDLDKKYQATDRAKTADQSYGISQRANNFFSGLSSYFEKASNTPTGKKIAQFYLDGSRQVQDIHTEARRLADLKTEEHGGSAYKAAGFDKVFGKEREKEKPAAAADTATADTAAAPAPGAPSTDAKSG
ncbi:hypothetical protein Trco_005067 [Trichoderma cornu-damae]|uniref:RRM domain-containing protein n=1 Tax=Trichoderma cornu-damae TaxID=654480 RepID=A0A9P8TUV6_9HYPO|nr:hypothetical protein Trco_005067 [Trichoderma cornu-damae]